MFSLFPYSIPSYLFCFWVCVCVFVFCVLESYFHFLCFKQQTKKTKKKQPKTKRWSALKWCHCQWRTFYFYTYYNKHWKNLLNVLYMCHLIQRNLQKCGCLRMLLQIYVVVCVLLEHYLNYTIVLTILFRLLWEGVESETNKWVKARKYTTKTNIIGRDTVFAIVLH